MCISNSIISSLHNISAEYTEQIKQALVNHRLCLCVGAGITRTYVGDWNELLNSIASLKTFDYLVTQHRELEYQKNQVDDYISHLETPTFFPSQTDVLEKGEYWMHDARDDSRYINSKNESSWREVYFATQVKYAIDVSVHKHLGMMSLEDYFLSKEVGSGSTLEALVELCVKGQINDIIIYNFDDIVDQLLLSPKVWEFYHSDPTTAFDPKIHQRSICIYSNHSSEPVYQALISSSKPINIHHVHGLLSNLIPRIEPIIFSEDSYLRFQSSLLNYSNVKMLELMSECSMLCVGFSGDDSNFRLLCRTIKESNERTYSSDRKHGIYITRRYSDIRNHFTTLSKGYSLTREQHSHLSTACFTTYVEAVTDYFGHLYNVGIVWYPDFSDIAKALHALANIPGMG